MTTRIVHPNELTHVERRQMFGLMTTYYDGVLEEAFERDLSEKDCVILLEEAGVIGFSTQKIIELNGVRAVFSGDTIIDRAHWGTQQLSQSFARAFFDYEGGPLYWFLISKGYKTYRYLPTFFQEFYPRYDALTPSHMKQLLDGLGEMLYPAEYDKERGVIAYQTPKDRLKSELQELSVRSHDPHYEFFRAANPRFTEGDDLACITLLSRKNLRKGAERRLFGEDSR